AFQDVTASKVAEEALDGPLRACARGACHDAEYVDRLDRPRDQPAAFGHHYQRQYMSSDVEWRSAECRRCAPNRTADHSRRQSCLGGDHAITCPVQQEGIQGGVVGSERGHTRSNSIDVERSSEESGDSALGARGGPPDRHRGSCPAATSHPEPATKCL